MQAAPAHPKPPRRRGRSRARSARRSPAGRAAGRRARPGAALRTRACSASSARRSPSSSTRLVVHLESAPRGRCGRRRRAGRATDELVLASASSLRWRGSLGGVLGALLELGEVVRLLLGLSRSTAHALDDRPVLLGDPLEELRALEQVGEAVGLEHHGEGIGLVRLVELDEPVREAVRATTSSLRRRSRRSRATSSLSRTSSSSACGRRARPGRGSAALGAAMSPWRHSMRGCSSRSSR